MSLLLTAGRLQSRRKELRGEIGALAAALAEDLEPVLARPIHIPDEKAMLSREGGRCGRDGALLTFDPFDPDRHRCPACGAVHTGERHRGFWRYWYHLWLAERAVHAAVLFQLRGDARHATFAAAVLDGYAARYRSYPNRDNALGPSRPFFSTYLESIWLLQLCLALDALEGADAGRHRALGATLREQLVAPSASLIASYAEGMSNRQVWNVAAQIAAARLLDQRTEAAPLLAAVDGLAALLARGILDDGTWYEGENYHMFAHRGLWYGVTMAEAAGLPLDAVLRSRFEAGFVAPFLTALPDMSLPSRRDSPYAISLRQPRFAEMCELGLARRHDPVLASALAGLYAAPSDVPRRDNGRRTTSADVERNLPAMQLARTDLGWRALLFARPQLPPTKPSLSRSVLMPGQGIAVLRRDAGQVYAALDYGHAGGGHGHPDRLNLLLVRGWTRWLDDMGTGSYVERTLHWYRSTLAHNAPLVNGRSQPRRSGVLQAWDERGGAGWAQAAFDFDDVRARRTIVAMPGYLVDELRWEAECDATVDLPLHAPMALREEPAWESASLSGGAGLEDGFEFVSDAARAPVAAGATIALRGDGDPPKMRATVATDAACEWWRGRAPGPPGAGLRHFHLIRMRGRSGRIRSVWAWDAGAATDVVPGADAITVAHADGATDRHSETEAGWRIDLQARGARSSIDLGGRAVSVPPDHGQVEPPAPVPEDAGGSDHRREELLTSGDVRTWTLGAAQYRRSESTWEEAGRPRATVTLRREQARLLLQVDVMKRDPLVFVPAGAVNPLDNDPPEINGDGVQLYVTAGADEGGWTVVPIAGDVAARAVRVAGWDGLVLEDTRWRASADGFAIEVAVVLPSGTDVVQFGVVVNETAPGRLRRRGQLVLGGSAGEWAYLRGDRHDRSQLLPIRLRHDDLT